MGSSQNTNGDSHPPVVEDEGPACQSCRKKKSKCSRQQPCSQCERANIECLYDDRKSKPGLKVGVVEALSQRIDSLEKMFLGQSLLLQQVLDSNRIDSLHTPKSSRSEADLPSGLQQTSLTDQIQTVRHKLLHAAENKSNDDNTSELPPAKRRRLHQAADTDPVQIDESKQAHNGTTDSVGGTLPQEDLIYSLVDDYFDLIHPWVPVLHKKLFLERIQDPVRRHDLTTLLLLNAIVSVSVRFSTDSRLAGNPQQQERYSEQCSQFVIVQSMNTFSVESLEALVIVAFDTIGSGKGPSSWSIVGSMTRTVEHLQLSFEDEDEHAQKGKGEFLIRRMAFLDRPRSWSESEERRRVFWNVFLMDRFCSIATGWNTSLKSTDVRRRLPCEGAIWEAGTPVKTPFFGIADRSHRSMPPGTAPSSTRELSEAGELEAIGGFAFCIEASESLSLVTDFFLRHAVDLAHVQEVQIWLMKFKELDLRLVQWKVFLPTKWASARVEKGHMDPNLTLAHLTHNTAVILLHQSIALPSAKWRSCPITLPSTTSADTCITAAIEISTIASKFLSTMSGPTNPQFSFCLFMAGRVLLAHSNYTGAAVRPEIDTLINSLLQLAQRWSGVSQSEERVSENLASRFAMRLMRTRDGSAQSPLDIQKPAYSDEAEIEGITGPACQPNTNSYPGQAWWYSNSSESPESLSLAFPPLPPSFQQQLQSWDQQATANDAAVNDYGMSSLDSRNVSQFASVEAYGGSPSAADIATQHMDVGCGPPLDTTSGRDPSLDKISAIFADPEFFTHDRVLMYARESNNMQ
ncbi:hypothetical protein FQN54_003004 [Arachnomyces sp. PD_36]|nr:hypothetical protein FQN54_003004 [Arachnomyces sp. PD_36]